MDQPDMPGDTCGMVTCQSGWECCDETRSLCVNPEPPCFAPFDCDQLTYNAAPTCNVTAPLRPGYLATHLDVAADPSDGTVILSAYSPGLPPFSRYGDLIVGVFNGSSPDDITWSHVDGLPTDGGSTSSFNADLFTDSSGWRGGLMDGPGGSPNVGTYNSIAINGGTIGISYYDIDNGDLKYAQSTDGGATWSVHQVYGDADDSGQFSSLTFLADGRPAIAFNSQVPAADSDARPISLTRVAIAGSAAPAASSDWTVQDIEPSRQDTNCAANTCGDGYSCRADGFCALDSTDASTDCSYQDGSGMTVAGCPSDSACIETSPGNPMARTFECVATADIRTAEFVTDLPEVSGMFNALRATADGLALVWYDRRGESGGNLWGSSYNAMNDTWDADGFLIDGYARVSEDRGLRVDMAIDASGNWHLAYINAYADNRGAVTYAVIDGTTVTNATPSFVVAPEVVDNGSAPTIDGEPPSIVGADIDIEITSGGEPRIVYQDQTRSLALISVRSGGGTWGDGIGGPAATVDDSVGAGFWTAQVIVADTSFVASWARDPTNVTTVREFVTPTPPPAP